MSLKKGNPKKLRQLGLAITGLLILFVLVFVIFNFIKNKNKNQNQNENQMNETEVKQESNTMVNDLENENKVIEKETQEELEMKGYKLIWEDHFEGDTLDLNSWNYEYHEPGWVNNELQSYVDSPENIYVKDGELIIQAIKHTEGTEVSYTSGRINTKDKHDYKYGRFEARAKVPNGKGFLPAFWMMPTNENLYGQWPKCGEIDIMEVLGDATSETHGTLHFGEPHTFSQGSYILEAGDFSSEYHVFACEWEPGEIRFYVDGELYHTENDWFTKKSGFGTVTYPAPYDQPFYLILNLAVGGNWPGNPGENDVFGENARLLVDYVKVYQKESYDENVEKPVEVLTFGNPDESGNYVLNGNLEQDENLPNGKNWQFLQAGTGVGTAETADGFLHIQTENEGDLEYSIQLVQPGMPMIQGSTYRLSFDAYASGERKMITNITAPDKGYIRYLADTSVDLSTQVQSYSYEFTMSDTSDVNGRVEFNMGNQGSKEDIYISNVRLEIIGTEDSENKEKTILPDGNHVYNGEFQEGVDRMESWTITKQKDEDSVLVTNENNQRELKIQNSEPVLVEQKALGLSANKQYILTFSTYADTEKDLIVKVAGLEFMYQATTTQNSITIPFHTEKEISEKDLKFLFEENGTYYLDDVRIIEDSLLLNGDFSSGITGYDLYAYTSSDVSYVIDELNEDKAICIDVKNTGDADWKIQLKQNNIKLKQGATYRITFDAKATMNRKIMFALQKDGSVDNDWTAYSGSQIVDLNSQYQTFRHEFEMTYETDLKTIWTISMGAVDGTQIDKAHTVIIDNIVLEEVSGE